ncbi:MAG: ankyrin repeat domain-containing protein, partial [Rhizomicrobium sp.]
GIVQKPYPHDCNVVEWAVQGQSDALPMVRRLLRRHPDLNRQNERGETALMSAAEFSSAPVIRLLLEHGADPWIVDKDGKTAVDYVRDPHPEKNDAVRVMRRWMVTHKKRR